MKKEVSMRRVLANRKNAENSTGPRTLAGKSRSRWNALKRGLCAKAVLIPGEDPSELRKVTKAFRQGLRPKGFREELCVERAVDHYWRYARAVRSESGQIGVQIEDAEEDADEQLTRDFMDGLRFRSDDASTEDTDDEETNDDQTDSDESDDEDDQDEKQDEDQTGEEDDEDPPLISEAKRASLGMINDREDFVRHLRYERTHERALERALNDLDKLQRQRKAREGKKAKIGRPLRSMTSKS